MFTLSESFSFAFPLFILFYQYNSIFDISLMNKPLVLAPYILNSQKCTFGVITEKLLDFLVSDRGIEVDPSKIKAILEMPSPKSEKEIRGFLARLQYISQFTAKLTFTCDPIFKPLRKNEPHTWNDECQKAFELIKEYLLHLPILVPPQNGKPLLL